ncbi:AraC family transcriptional regulator [Pedobacter miscanthi]|uniref:helix-turn-helix domain-containing protein n=1 Tax=Pedobacter miscanthi TaxID=2259170 RepID=UPI0029309817|nr:AraC family transcriptional regulator [Pedobacter miscanthi]
MGHISRYISPGIKLSCYKDRLFKSGVVFNDHMLIWLISGETKIVQAQASQIFKAGDIFLIPKDHPSTILNYPKDGLPHRNVVMVLTAEILREFYADLKVSIHLRPVPHIRSFDKHPLLTSCLDSLVPYFELEDLPKHIALGKIIEAIAVIRAVHPEIDGVLANFEEPGKADLIGFMEKNYMFNMTIEKFGYLTGRSLTTFKRDFKKAYKVTPRKWLTQKRLELAHFMIAREHRKPAEVLLEAGFENLSHFSYIFKKQFGYAPTELCGRSAGIKPVV